MADSGAIKAGQAYIELTLDKSKLAEQAALAQADIEKAHSRALEMNAARSAEIGKAEVQARAMNVARTATVDRAEAQAYTMQAGQKAAAAASMDDMHGRALEMNATRSRSVNRAEIQAYEMKAAAAADVDRAEIAGYAESERRSQAHLDKRVNQLKSHLWRITGAYALINVASAAIGGALGAMQTQKDFDFAAKMGDYNAMIAATQKIHQENTAWIRSIPLIGGALGKVIDLASDDNLGRIAAQLTAAQSAGIGLANALGMVENAELALMKQQGASDATIAAYMRKKRQRQMDEALGTQNEATNKARDAMNAAEQEVERLGNTRPGLSGRKLKDIEKPLTASEVAGLDKLKTAQEVAQAARVNYYKQQRATKDVEKARAAQGKADKLAEAAEAKAAAAPTAAVPGAITDAIEATALAGGSAESFGVARLPEGATGAPASNEETMISLQERTANAVEQIAGMTVDPRDIPPVTIA